MNFTRKILGPVWIALALVMLFYGIRDFGYPKLVSGQQDDLVFGIIIIFILLPIVVGGLLIFGWYSLKNEYDNVVDEHGRTQYQKE